MKRYTLLLSLASATTLAAPLAAQGRGRNVDGIPPGHYPSAGMCRIWIDGVPPGRQPRQTDCETARQQNLPANARVIYGSNRRNGGLYDRNGDGRIDNRDRNGNVYDRNGDGRIDSRDGNRNGNDGPWWDPNRSRSSDRGDGVWRETSRDRNGNRLYVRRRVDSNGNVIVERARRDSFGRYIVVDRQVIDRDRDGRDDDNDGWVDRDRDGRDDRRENAVKKAKNKQHKNKNKH